MPGQSATPAPVPSHPGSRPAPGQDGGDHKQLAKTGASSGTTLALGGGAAALIAAGGGALYAVRRKRA
ncbi:LPXTG cell wall anchor domain-containing protein [Streptomyces sp. BHT-5-2]|nr:LPXTG cell wall anchor domain-containing protein [Streptomyces sp. BHT-5-2]